MSMKPGHTTLPVASTVSGARGGLQPSADLVDAGRRPIQTSWTASGAAGRIDHTPALDQEVHAPLLPASM